MYSMSWASLSAQDSSRVIRVWAKPVTPGRTTSRCQYWGISRQSSAKKVGRIGRGPTTPCRRAGRSRAAAPRRGGSRGGRRRSGSALPRSAGSAPRRSRARAGFRRRSACGTCTSRRAGRPGRRGRHGRGPAGPKSSTIASATSASSGERTSRIAAEMRMSSARRTGSTGARLPLAGGRDELFEASSGLGQLARGGSSGWGSSRNGEAPTVPRIVSTRARGSRLVGVASAVRFRSSNARGSVSGRSRPDGSALRRRRRDGRRRWCRRACRGRRPRGSSSRRRRRRGRRGRPGSAPRPRRSGTITEGSSRPVMNSRCAWVRGRTTAWTPSSRPRRSRTLGKSGFDLRW